MATKEEIAEFLQASFPQSKLSIEAVGNRGCTVSLPVGDDQLRPLAGPRARNSPPHHSQTCG